MSPRDRSRPKCDALARRETSVLEAHGAAGGGATMADDVRLWSDELARDPSSPCLQLGESLRRQGQRGGAQDRATRLSGTHGTPTHDLVARIAVDRRDFARALDEGRRCCASSQPSQRDEGAGYVASAGRLRMPSAI